MQLQPFTGPFHLLLPEMQPANEGSSSVSPDSNGSGVRTTTAGLLRALAVSSPPPAPSVRPPARAISRLGPPQRVISEQSPDSLQTAASLVIDADVLRTRGRKPVIYLFPPSDLPSVTVELLLTSTWSFSAVYPPPQTPISPGERQATQSLTWAVAAELSGTLVDKMTGTEVSYLFWEAM